MQSIVWFMTRSPKYGNDDDYADDLMQDVFYLYHDLITGRPNYERAENTDDRYASYNLPRILRR